MDVLRISPGSRGAAIFDDAVLRAALRDVDFCAPPQPNEKGDYDPFDVAEKREGDARNEETHQARAEVIAHLLSQRPGRRDPELIKKIVARIVQDVTPGNLDYHLREFSAPFTPTSSNDEIDVLLRSLGAAEETVWRPWSKNTIWEIGKQDSQRPLLHISRGKIQNRSNRLSRMMHRMEMTCGRKVSEDALRPAKFGEWVDEFAKRCPGCEDTAHEDTSLEISWVEPPALEDTLAPARAVLSQWLGERLQHAKKLASDEGERWYQPTKDPGWNRVHRLAQRACKPAAAVIVQRWMQAAGDDALFLPLGEGRWRKMRSLLAADVHRAVDVFQERQLLQALADKRDDESWSCARERKDVSLPSLVAAAVTDASGLNHSRAGRNYVVDSLVSGDAALTLALDNPKLSYPTVLQQMNQELGIKTLKTDSF